MGRGVAAVILAAFAAGAHGQTNAELKEQLRQTEVAFAKTMADRDHAAFVSFLADEAVFLGRTALRGKAAVAEGWRRFYDGKDAPFSWEPDSVEVLDSGTLGLSSGPVRDQRGQRVSSFNSTWRRENDGSWKIVFDKGCPPCECAALPAPAPSPNKGGPVSNDSFYALKATTLQGRPIDLAHFAGKVTLAVNVASQCGYTPQYQGLQALQEELEGRGFSVLGFPSNEFGAQEPGSAGEIQTFCERNYGVTFPMFAKLVTQPGPGQSPVYAFLPKGGDVPKWNFAKYLVGKDGRLIAFYPSQVTPESKELRESILSALAK
jgi:glutathione peroxidase